MSGGTMADLGRFTHLTFDCYGTLIDWEAGILAAVVPVLEHHGVEADESRVLQLYAEHEATEESGPYKKYRDVLRGVMTRIGESLGFEATPEDRDALSYSVESWPPFDDSIDALVRLKTRYELAILSNVDDEIFRRTAHVLGNPFDTVITAEQVGSYKPAEENFRFALDRLGVPVERVLHVAQSLYHDHEPAKRLGFTTIRVNRPSRLPGVGVAMPADVVPDHEVPDMATLAVAAGV